MKHMVNHRSQLGSQVGLLKHSLVFLSSVAVFACSQRYQVPEVPQRLIGREVTVHLHDGRTVEAHAQPTSTGVVWRPTDGSPDIAQESVVSVMHSRRGRAALQGLGIGAATGAVVGAVLGFVDGDDPPCNSWLCFRRFTAEEKAAGLGIVFGVASGVVGAFIGRIKGSTDRYEFIPGGSAYLSAHPTDDGAMATLRWSF